MSHDDATQRQVSAADPVISTWLSANAGSGKTRVLTDRVARLLLRRVSPQNILCLTYTKAAATEMQNRLFRRLGSWAMKDDKNLCEELRGLGIEDALDADDLAHARTLFARAIETPGGLKIQTIHSFCASLLRRFPVEAGVSPFFTEIDDRSAKLLREEVVEELSDGPNRAIMERLARRYTGEDFDALTKEIVGCREAFLPARKESEIWAACGLPAGYSEDDLAAALFLSTEGDLLRRVLPELEASAKPTDLRAAARLADLLPDGPSLADFDTIAGLFLYGPSAKQPFGAKTGSFPTKETRDALVGVIEDLDAFMQRVADARPLRLALRAAERSKALHDFAAIFLPEYIARKEARGWLDFDDLIIGARNLLSDPAVAGWVLYRLDGGIDHILVDEAQDTSPAQWAVIRLLAQEFTAGKGARENRERTIFVVGDLKQSIYSFQGADPAAFDEMRVHFETGLTAAGARFQQQSLDHSFRSSPAILSLVDATFRAAGHAGLGSDSHHIAYYEETPGRVDLWPIVPNADATEDREWFDPTDKPAENDCRIVLAEKIATEIGRMIESGSISASSGDFRPITPGDFLILVQRRSMLFHEIIRACKARGLDVAGADRLKIGAELAVRDLKAMLAFLATPDDDLSLACVLRSPLIGLSEAQLYDLAHSRSEIRLWPALRRRSGDFPETHEILFRLRNQADFLSPYELLERILTRFRGRENLLARLGSEAEDGIDAMLSLAMAYERTETPSLTGFLTWMETDEVEIKRQSDSAGDRIRVMTTHGAKGLESPIVILPDTADRRLSLRDQIIPAADGMPLWKTASADMPAAMAEAAAGAKRAQDEERMRLLYVALTRAETWLIVCGCGESGKDPGNWHGLVEAGMKEAGAALQASPAGDGLRLQVGEWARSEPLSAEPGAVADRALPDWITTRAQILPELSKTVSPSGLGGPKVLAGSAESLDQDAAMERGNQLHLLLEHMPLAAADLWPDLVHGLLCAGPAALPPEAADQLLTEARMVIENPELRHLFGPNALAEVPVSATLAELDGKRINGAIDRLVIDDDHVLAVDYKSNATIPETPDQVPLGLLRQMGAYAAALSQIYPDRRIDSAILWTRSATLMPLPHDLLRQALDASSTS